MTWISKVQVGNKSYSGGIFLDPMPGESIEKTSRDACWVAFIQECEVRFVFNGVNLKAYPGQDHKDLIELFHARLKKGE